MITSRGVHVEKKWKEDNREKTSKLKCVMDDFARDKYGFW